MEKINEIGNSGNFIRQNNDGSTTIITKDGVRYNLIKNKNIDFKQKLQNIRKGIKGTVKVEVLIGILVIACGFGIVDKGKDYKDAKDAKKEEEARLKNNLDFYIDNADLAVVKMFVDEVLDDLADKKDYDLAAENTYNAMHNELVIAEKTPDFAINIPDFALHIRESAKLASNANIYFGVGKYEKYLNAKKYNNEVYFPFDAVLPTYSLEDIASEIVITYLPEDKTPYVSSIELEDYKKSKENKDIKKFINIL